MILTSYLGIIMKILERAVFQLTKLIISTRTLDINKVCLILNDWFFDQDLWTSVTVQLHRIQASFAKLYITVKLHSSIHSVGSVLFLDFLVLGTATEASIGQCLIANAALHRLLQLHNLMIGEPKFLLIDP